VVCGALTFAAANGAQAPPSASSKPAPPAGGDQDLASRSRDASENSRIRNISRFLIRQSRNASSAQIGGAEVMAHVGKLSTDSDDFRALATLEPGAVLELPGAAVCKLRNEVGLRFGDVELPIGNVSPGYAGLYGFWLRAPAAGSEQWSLIWNDEADVWGTQRDPARDRVETPIEHDTTGEEAKELSVAIEVSAGGDAGTLVLSWGPHRWRAPFTVSR
jgi:hypothetical protein